MHGMHWPFDAEKPQVSFSFDGGMEGGLVHITVEDDEVYVSHSCAHRVGGKQICPAQMTIKVPARALIELVFNKYIVPKLVGLIEMAPVSTFEKLIRALTVK